MIAAKVDQEKYEQLREYLRTQEGIDLKGVSGLVEAHGCQVSYSYNAGAEQLVLNVTRKPLLLPKSVVEGKLRDGLRSQGVECGWAG